MKPKGHRLDSGRGDFKYSYFFAPLFLLKNRSFPKLSCEVAMLHETCSRTPTVNFSSCLQSKPQFSFFIQSRVLFFNDQARVYFDLYVQHASSKAECVQQITSLLVMPNNFPDDSDSYDPSTKHCLQDIERRVNQQDAPSWHCQEYRSYRQSANLFFRTQSSSSDEQTKSCLDEYTPIQTVF